MAPKPIDNINMDIRQLQKDLEALRDSSPNGKMSDYHRDLLKWAQNVDRRYAWVVLIASHLLLMSTLGPYRVYGLLFAAVAKEGLYSREEASWPVSMIFTVENIFGPIVSIIVYYITFRKSILIGGLLMTLSNLAAFFSRSILLDVLFIGIIQGIGYAFIFMPFMEIINGYFVRYRNLALGIALCGGTVSNFFLTPIFQWILDNNHWRAGYLGTFCVTSLCVFMVPLLKPNMRPIPPIVSAMLINRPAGESLRHTVTRNSMRSLAYANNRNSRSGPSMAGNPARILSRQASVVSVNPFASSLGRVRKISNNHPGAPNIAESIAEDYSRSPQQVVMAAKNKLQSTLSKHSISTIDQYEVMSLNEVLQEGSGGTGEPGVHQEDKSSPTSGFDSSLIWDILKTPAFHLIWLLEVVYFWIFSIFCLVVVDFGVDHGLPRTDAESLLNFLAIGELFGRLFLSYLADLNLMANRKIVALDLVIVAALMTIITQTSNYYYMAACTLGVFGLSSLLYILINVLLVEYLGERQVTLGYGLASCIGGVLLIFRPNAVGYFRDHLGTYDPLIMCMVFACLLSATLWIFEPLITRLFTKRTTKNNNKDSSPV